MRLGILISGRGFNMCAILEAISVGKLVVICVVVVSNNVDALGLAMVGIYGVGTVVVDHCSY